MTRDLTDRIVRAFGWLDAVEFIIPAFIAGVLLAFWPLLACSWLLRARHHGSAFVSGRLWLLMAFCLVRDLRRRRFGVVSLTLSVIWLVAAGEILWQLE